MRHKKVLRMEIENESQMETVNWVMVYGIKLKTRVKILILDKLILNQMYLSLYNCTVLENWNEF